MAKNTIKSRIFDTRQTIKHYLSLYLQNHWYPGTPQYSWRDTTSNVICKSSKSKFVNHCIRITTRLSLLLCLPIFMLISKLYQWIASKIIAHERQPPSNLSRKLNGCKLITVGNVVVGGVGKTPTVLAIIQRLKAQGFRVAVASKGYAGDKLKTNHSPEIIQNNMTQFETAKYFGDEPTLISRLSSTPVCVSKDRRLAIELLISEIPELDYIIADDGLQSLHQFSEKKVVVFDERFLGNGFCLPYGPLREPWPPPYVVDAMILNFSAGSEVRQTTIKKLIGNNVNFGQIFESKLQTRYWENLEGKRIRCDEIHATSQINTETSKKKVLACAGIGVPSKFFVTLRSLGLEFDALPLSNHEININDIIEKVATSSYDLILTTEKDGVKLNKNNKEIVKKLWKLNTEMYLPDDFYRTLIEE